jgi:hypothetical protein
VGFVTNARLAHDRRKTYPLWMPFPDDRPRRIISSAALTLCGIGAMAVADDREAAARAAERYAECLNLAEIECLLDLTYPTPNFLQVWRPDRPPPLPTQAYLFEARKLTRRYTYTYWLLGVSTPAPIDVDSELRFMLVPYRLQGFAGFWYERTGYFVSVSGDGENWCFIEDAVVEARGLERIMPGYEGPALPTIARTQMLEPGLVESPYLETVVGAFSIPDDSGDGYYELEFEIGKRIRDEIPLVISYENPEDSERPYVVRSFIAPQQDLLHIVSPRIRGFKTNVLDEVSVTGFDPETDDVLFEHRQPMAFRPVEGHDSEYIPAIASIASASYATRTGLFPIDWIQRFEVSAENLCAGSNPP